MKIFALGLGLILLSSLPSPAGVSVNVGPNLHSGQGVEPMKTTVFEGRTYVSGRIRRSLGVQVATGAHVDVFLLDGDGRPFFCKTEKVKYRSTSPVHTGIRARVTYLASFPNEQAAKARSIEVQFVNGPHRKCVVSGNRKALLL